MSPAGHGPGSGLRVGLVCPYSLDSFGGVQQHVTGLAAGLRRAGHDVRVLAPGDPRRERPDGVSVVGEGPSLPFNGSVAPVRIGARREVRSWLQQGAFDVVHVHEPAAPSTSFTVVRALLDSDMPVVATHHIAQERALTLRVAGPTVLRQVLRRVDAHVVVSAEARRTLGRYHSVDDVEVATVPNGVAVADLDLGPGRPHAERRDVVLVGRPEEPRKGFEVLLEAFPEVLRRHPWARLVVVGGSGSARDLPGPLRRRVAALGDGVLLAGRLDEGGKARALADARVLVAPNTGGESFGIVLAEAMAAGAPVVASDLEAFRAVLDDARLGRLVPPGDPRALAGAVSDVLADPAQAERLAQAARAAAYRRFDWSVVVPQVVAVYADVVRRRGPVPGAGGGAGGGAGDHARSVGLGRPPARNLGT